MKRLLCIAALALAALAAPTGEAAAHPLGNFSINHLSEVRISEDRVDVLYVLDEAEVPTVNNRDVAPGELVRKKRAAIIEGLALTVDGRRVALRESGPGKLTFPAGQGGLRTTRLELPLRASASDSKRVELRDDSFSGRVGWKAVVAEPGEGTSVRTATPTGDPTDRLRRYPENLVDSPLDRRAASFVVEPGEGELEAPKAEGQKTVTTRENGGDGLASVFEKAASGEGVVVLFLLTALGWGALHALSPGHGKAMVAAYLVGTRGTARDAVALGATVTVTHTVGVFALGLVALLLSQYVLPEDLYPWLTLVSGLLVVVIGAGVLSSRLRWFQHGHAHGDGHSRSQDHSHSPDHTHSHGHDHHHHHGAGEKRGMRGVIGMGAAAGLIPCPSALVVLLGAVAQHQVALGLLLIVAFSVGLAGTLTVLGLVVVHARRFTPRLRMGGRVARLVPALSALLIMLVGVVLTARAVPEIL